MTLMATPTTTRMSNWGGHSMTVVVIVVTVHLLCGGAVTYCVCVWWAYDANDAIIATIYFLRMHLSIYLLIHSVS